MRYERGADKGVVRSRHLRPVLSFWWPDDGRQTVEVPSAFKLTRSYGVRGNSSCRVAKGLLITESPSKPGTLTPYSRMRRPLSSKSIVGYSEASASEPTSIRRCRPDIDLRPTVLRLRLTGLNRGVVLSLSGSALYHIRSSLCITANPVLTVCSCSDSRNTTILLWLKATMGGCRYIHKDQRGRL